MNIFVENLIFSGIHGLTEKEKHTPQRFRIDITVTPWNSSSDDMIDYRVTKHIVKTIIEKEHYELIETLAKRIAENILIDQRIFSTKVSIRKLDIWDNGVPGVEITRQAIPPINLLDFDINMLLHELLFYGGTSFPILPEKRREALTREAESYTYEKQPEIVGTSGVREQLSSYKILKKDSLFLDLKKDITELLNYKLSLTTLRPFGNATISFNEPSFQRYESGSIGITPHVDNFSCKNLVLVFLLKGRGDFFLCDDRSGSNPRMLDTTPGNVIILRAPGFFGSTKRPFHYITNISEERIIFGLRHDTTQP